MTAMNCDALEFLPSDLQQLICLLTMKAVRWNYHLSYRILFVFITAFA